MHQNPFLHKDPNAPQFKLGARYGLMLLIGGLLVVLINAVMIYASDNYFPKLFVVGAWLTLLSIAFFIFQGGKVAEKPAPAKLGMELWRNAPGSHKAVWIVWAVITGVASFYMLTQFDPDFWK